MNTIEPLTERKPYVFIPKKGGKKTFGIFLGEDQRYWYTADYKIPKADYTPVYTEQYSRGMELY